MSIRSEASKVMFAYHNISENTFYTTDSVFTTEQLERLSIIIDK